jgi:hypothetical protein
MQSFSTSTMSHWTNVFYYPSSVVIVGEGDSVRMHRGFTYAGFGPGDGTQATPGSFVKAEEYAMHGRIWNEYSGPPLYTQEISGNLTSFGCVPFVAGGTFNSSRNKAIDKLYDKIRGETSGAGEDIGERHETLDLLDRLQHPIRTFGEETRDFARSQNKFRKAAKNSGGAYLTYAFGVAPLLDDIQSLTKQLDEQLDSVQNRVKVRSTSYNTDTESRFSDANQGTTKATTQRSHRTEIGVSYFVTDPTLFRASKAGLTNPVLTAYQLTRASFLVDWVWNLGNYLDRCENALGLGLSFLRGYETVTTYEDSQCVYTREVSGAGASGGGSARGYMQTRTKQRTRLDGFPFPSPPGITSPFKPGGKRLLSAASLLTSLL